MRADQRLRSPDIYGGGTVIRDVLSLRGLIRPGNSGGPVVDSGGHVVGVVFAASVTSGDTGYALSSQQVAQAAAAGSDRVAHGVDAGLRGVRRRCAQGRDAGPAAAAPAPPDRTVRQSRLRICLVSWACAIAFSGPRTFFTLRRPMKPSSAATRR